MSAVDGWNECRSTPFLIKSSVCMFSLMPAAFFAQSYKGKTVATTVSLLPALSEVFALAHPKKSGSIINTAGKDRNALCFRILTLVFLCKLVIVYPFSNAFNNILVNLMFYAACVFFALIFRETGYFMKENR